MMTFAQRLTTLTDSELDKLERILLLFAQYPNHNLEELLELIGTTPTDADLIGSRTYELEICHGLDPAEARRQALEEFEAGKLHKPKKSISIPRYKGKGHAQTAQALPATVTAVADKPMGLGHPTEAPSAPNAPEAAQTPSAPELPSNVVPFRCYSKFFHKGSSNVHEVW
jgi:hypothetical protein